MGDHMTSRRRIDQPVRFIREALDQAYSALADYPDGTPQTDVFDALDAIDEVEALLRRVTLNPCRRMRENPSAPTCRSPVVSEGLPREQWCFPCEVREVLNGSVV